MTILYAIVRGVVLRTSIRGKKLSPQRSTGWRGSGRWLIPEGIPFHICVAGGFQNILDQVVVLSDKLLSPGQKLRIIYAWINERVYNNQKERRIMMYHEAYQ